jgi:hypothetical protein
MPLAQAASLIATFICLGLVRSDSSNLVYMLRIARITSNKGEVYTSDLD